MKPELKMLVFFLLRDNMTLNLNTFQQHLAPSQTESPAGMKEMLKRLSWQYEHRKQVFLASLLQKHEILAIPVRTAVKYLLTLYG